jgi:cell wall-associated NlpC family hydrolase
MPPVATVALAMTLFLLFTLGITGSVHPVSGPEAAAVSQGDRWSTIHGFPGSDPRATTAVNWALDQVGELRQPDGTLWSGWCLRFVANAYGAPFAGRKSAHTMFTELSAAGRVSRTSPIPRGALVFWEWHGAVDGVARRWDHVGIYVGNGRIVHTSYAGVRNDPLDYLDHLLSCQLGRAARLGWALAPPDWPGR